MNNVYLTAESARKLSLDAESLKSEVLEQETLVILDKIAKAANNGERIINISGYLQKSIVQRLQALGYSVKEYSDQREGAWITITW